MHTFFVMKQVQVAVVGASGYTGQELLRILLNHRGVRLVCATSRQYAGQPLWEVFPRFRQVPGSDLRFTDSDVEAIAATGAEVAFLALPHGVAASYARGLVDRGVRVIDLSADFRLNCPDVYEEYYGNAHPDTALMQEAVYGLPEWRPAEIARRASWRLPVVIPPASAAAHPFVQGRDSGTGRRGGVFRQRRKRRGAQGEHSPAVLRMQRKLPCLRRAEAPPFERD